MNIQEYISSGIVESYVLGLASNDERAEFEQLCSQYPELVAARISFEQGLEQYTISNAVTPPSSVKEKVWSEIKPGTAPVVTMNPKQSSGKIITGRSGEWFKYLAAASVILLVSSTFLNFYFYRRYQDSLARYENLFANTQQMAKENRVQQTKLELYQSSIRLMNDSNMAVIALKGRPISPSSRTTIYWDKQTKDVYLLVNNLPQPATDKQYQLWAIVDGQPVDAGIFDMNNATALIKMKNIPKAQAFAITLEKKGGSISPTLPMMFVMGQI